MALREPSRLGKFIGPRLLYCSSQCKCEKASFHEVIWERSRPRRGGLGVDAGWGRLRRPGGALNYWRNFCTEPAYLSPPHTPQPGTTSHVAVSARDPHNSAGLQACRGA